MPSEKAHNLKIKMGQTFRGTISRTTSGNVPTGQGYGTNNSDVQGRPNNHDGTTEHSGLLSHVTNHVPNMPKYYQDSRPYVSYPAAFFHTSWLVLKSNYANILLVFVPLGIIGGVLEWDPVVVFVLNFLAIVPLAGLLSFATEELAAKLGQTLGGLLNATFGNAVELIVSVVALLDGQIRIVQSSMLGSILSNILLVLGCCFIAAGVKHHEGVFNSTAAQAMSGLMAVAAAALIIPAALYSTITDTKSGKKADESILVLSHGTAIILLILYVLFIVFQLYTHADMFDEEAQHVEGEDQENGDQPQEDEEEGPKDGDTLAPIPAGIALVLVTIVVAICAEYLVDSIDSLVTRTGISKTFIGLILLPIVGNAAEHVTACVVSYKGKMNLALGVAIGSSMQIALFLTPFLVILGWCIGQNMTLHFQGFETIVFFLSVLVVNYLIQDGKSNYLEGAMCLGMYIIIAIAFYVYPDDAGDIGSVVKHFFHNKS